jgi:vacuolar-type H+-ATPase subunit I/STV1
MSIEKIPADLIKDAEEIQSALRQVRDLSEEVKELKAKVKTTPEFEAVKHAKKLLKGFEKANPSYADLKREVKQAQATLRETKQALDAAEAAKQLKEYKDSIKEVGRHMAERILDKKLAAEQDDTANEV